jgi:hypothetical protein
MKSALAALLILAACSSQKPAPAAQKSDPPAAPAAGTPAAGTPAETPAGDAPTPSAGTPAAGTPAGTPAATTPAAPAPTGAAEILSKEDLLALPDDQAREAARAFTKALAAEDAPAFLALVPAAGLKIGKKKLALKDVEARAAKEGVGKLTRLGLDEEAKKVGASIVLAPTMQEEKGKAPRFFLSGPGYGDQPAAFFEKQADGSWKIVALDVYDFGEP